jgi:carboxymethylenebutenolidase
MIGGIPRERHDGDVLSTIAYLKAQPDVTDIGIIGFCFGGGITWRAAAASADLSAAVPFYGANPPLDLVPNIKAAVYAVYGELDERINAGIDDITAALKSAGTNCDMKVYPNAPHAFHNHTNGDRYVADAAETAWADALTWFSTHLKS